MPNLLLANKLIDELGGTGAAACLLEKTDPAVSMWRKNGIPKSYMQLIRYKRPKIYKKVMEDMRTQEYDKC
jgi:hypothetical protein